MDFIQELADSFAPQILATFVTDEKDKARLLALGEICKKHGVKFTTYFSILQDLSKWEEST